MTRTSLNEGRLITVPSADKGQRILAERAIIGVLAVVKRGIEELAGLITLPAADHMN